MLRIITRTAGVAIMLTAFGAHAQTPTVAPAQTAPAEFLKRVAEHYRAAVQGADRNKDGMLTREEARGDLLLQARFDDIDTNRDGVISREELERFLADIPPHAR
jgi:Ca2+-binding EF-hand superfamily protein